MQNSQIDNAAVENTSRRGRGRGRRHHQIEGEHAERSRRGRGRGHHHLSPHHPAHAISLLLKKQLKAADALNSLDLDEKRRQRLIEKKNKIDAQLQELMNAKQEEPENEQPKEEEQAPQTITLQQPQPSTPLPEVQEKVEEKKQDPQETLEIADEKNLALLADSRHLYKQALREASQKYLSLQKELKDEHHRIKRLRQVVKALKILSKAGIESRAAVSPQQSEMAEEDLALAKQRIGEKKLAAREQARAVRELIRTHKKEHHRKSGHKRHRRERKEEEEGEKRVHARRHQKKAHKVRKARKDREDCKEEKTKHQRPGRKLNKAKKVRYERKTRQVKRYRKSTL